MKKISTHPADATTPTAAMALKAAKKAATTLATTLATALAMVFTIVATTSCETEVEGGRMIVIDNIYVEPEMWKASSTNGGFDHFYADIPLAELNQSRFERGMFTTYWKYNEKDVAVQKSLPAVINLDRFENENWIQYTETIACSYDMGYLRLTISRSDFFDRPPTEKLEFRTVIYY